MMESRLLCSDNVYEVASWCNGSYHYNGDDVSSYVSFDANAKKNPRTSKAYMGMWVVNEDGNFQAYSEEQYRAAYPKTTYVEGLTFADKPEEDSETDLKMALDKTIGMRHYVVGLLVRSLLWQQRAYLAEGKTLTNSDCMSVINQICEFIT